ncbi:MAG: PKD domain-containing protein [Fimbriimonadaceae bacterium]|nr:PKD domain-containing protein [Fimbriimonadaceae bacterium]QYK56330.1 MAG: PKD domain-containing protein [Fimbriimonadaceae bacterium]
MKLRTVAPIAALALGAVCGAQVVYTPTRSIADQGITLERWGSGTIRETDETAFEGSNSLRVSSRNFFQGGIVTFSNAVSLADAYGDKNNLLQFTLHVPGAKTSEGGAPAFTRKRGGAAGAGGGGAPDLGAGGSPAGRGGSTAGGQNPGSGARGRAGANQQSNTATVQAETELEKVRLVIETSDGKRSEAFLDVKGRVADERGWMKASIPLQAIRGFGNTNKEIKSIALAGDAVASFNVGEARIVNDATPIYGEVEPREQNRGLGEELTFLASGFGGSVPLRYQWDFDDSDGIQVDAEGPVVRRRFRKPGKFTVTLTIIDQYGLKEPYKTTSTVEINP